MKIAVAGTGYVGLSIATLLSQHDEVVAVDVVSEKVAAINNRKSPLRVMSARIARGTSPFYPDKTHLHHAFIDLGFSHIGATFSILSMNSLVVLAWLVAYKCGATIDLQLYIVIAMSILATFGLYAFIYYHIRRNTTTCHVMRVIASKTHFERKGVWATIQKWIDRNAKPVDAVNA